VVCLAGCLPHLNNPPRLNLPIITLPAHHNIALSYLRDTLDDSLVEHFARNVLPLRAPVLLVDMQTRSVDKRSDVPPTPPASRTARRRVRVVMTHCAINQTFYLQNPSLASV
jgi:hypothetical protein